MLRHPSESQHLDARLWTILAGASYLEPMGNTGVVQIRRIGVIGAKKENRPSESSVTGDGGTGFSQILKVIDACQRRFGLPLELESLVAPLGEAGAFEAVIFEDSLDSPGALSWVAPFFANGSGRESFVIWPASRTAASSSPEGWIETRFVPSGGMGASIRLAIQASDEREGAPIEVVCSEDNSIGRWFGSALGALPSKARFVAESPRAAIDFNSPSDGGVQAFSRVILADPIVGPGLARFVDANLIIGFDQSGPLSLRATCPGIGPVLAGVATLFDRLGFAQAAEALIEISRSSPSNASETLILNQIIEYSEGGA